jgi:hypothetical protein
MKWFAIMFIATFGIVFIVGGLFAALIAGVGVGACSAIAWDRGNDSSKAIGRHGGF